MKINLKKIKKYKWLIIISILAMIGALSGVGYAIYQNIQHDQQVQLELKKQELKIKCLNEYNDALAAADKIDTTYPEISNGIYIPTVSYTRNVNEKNARLENAKTNYNSCISDVDKIK